MAIRDGVVLMSELVGLIEFVRPFLSMVSKAKAAKLVRCLVDMFLDMEAGTGKEVSSALWIALSRQLLWAQCVLFLCGVLHGTSRCVLALELS